MTADRDDRSRGALITFNATVRPRRRLVCVPFAGGGPSTYRLWRQTLPADIEVVALQLPGRGPRTQQVPPSSIDEIASGVLRLLNELSERDPLPFAIFGHSMGALIAFEVTISLEENLGPSPTHLFVSGRKPPDEPYRGETIHDLPDSEFIDAMHHNYGGIPDAIRDEPELLAMLLPGLRADVRAYETYAGIPGRLVRCAVSVYGGEDDERPRPEQLAGWQRVVEHPISLKTFAGGHFYVNESRAALTAAIASDWASRTTEVEAT